MWTTREPTVGDQVRRDFAQTRPALLHYAGTHRGGSGEPKTRGFRVLTDGGSWHSFGQTQASPLWNSTISWRTLSVSCGTLSASSCGTQPVSSCGTLTMLRRCVLTHNRIGLFCALCALSPCSPPGCPCAVSASLVLRFFS